MSLLKKLTKQEISSVGKLIRLGGRDGHADIFEGIQKARYFEPEYLDFLEVGSVLTSHTQFLTGSD